MNESWVSVFARTWEAVRPYIPEAERQRLAEYLLLTWRANGCTALEGPWPWPEVEAAWRKISEREDDVNANR
jgi:hypothetical protein